MEKSILEMSKAKVEKEKFLLEVKGYIQPKSLFLIEKALNKLSNPIKLNNDNTYIIK